MKERAGALTEVGAPAFSFLQLNRCIRGNGTKQVKNSFSVPSVWKRMVLDKIKNGFPFQVAIIAWYWTSQKQLFSSTCWEANGTRQDKNAHPFHVATIAWYWTSQKQLFSSTCREANGTKQDKNGLPFQVAIIAWYWTSQKQLFSSK